MTRPDDRIAIQAAMRAAFPQAEARVATFYHMQEYQLGWRDEQLQLANYDPGKLLRPYIVLLGCQVAGGDPHTAMPLAAGIQLIHDFSLIHDDIEDDGDTRRGRPTVWKVWGLAQGLNAGDGMFVIAHLSLHRLSDVGVPPEVVLDILRRFDQTIITICEGQYLDLSYEGNLAIDEAAYIAMISRKTAALVAAACGLGAILGGASASLAKTMFDFGQNLGLAFQIQDDLLGIWGDPAEMGKPFAADLIRRKVSLPVIYGLQHAEQRRELAQLYQQPHAGDEELHHILTILEQAGSRAYCEQAAASYHHQALTALNAAPGQQAPLAELRAIANRLLGRKS
ncbi:MAG: polyprenyl synthetase family protein [Roseiflexaceae bacterium]|nr:polyprenyl synthetase family protein [Roseiflexaceae bacterium]